MGVNEQDVADFMGDKNIITRRGFLTRLAIGAGAGAVWGATRDLPASEPVKPDVAPKGASSKKADRQQPQEPVQQPIQEVLPDVLNPDKREGSIASGATLGWAVTEGGHRILFGKNPPDRSADLRREEIARDFHAGREHERWQERSREADAGNKEHER